MAASATSAAPAGRSSTSAPTAVSAPGRIAPLPDPTSWTMRAHLAFPTLSSLSLALAQNALDAGARAVVLTLDWRQWSIRCEDDGRGFGMGFFQAGGEGTQAGSLLMVPAQGSTSRYLHKHGRYGWRGTSLHLMAHLGRLRLSSVPEKAPHQAYMRIQAGLRCLYAGGDPTRASSSALRKGSIVVLSDLFAEMPVRRRALDTTSKRRAEMERIRRALAVQSLREPQASFVFQVTSPGADEHDWASIEQRELLRISKATSLQARFMDVYSHLALEGRHLVEVHSPQSDEEDAVVVRGLIGLRPIHSKEAQHIFVQRHLLEPGATLVEHLISKDGSFREGLGRATRDGQESPTKTAVRGQFKDADVDIHGAVLSVFQGSTLFKQSTTEQSERPSTMRPSPSKSKGVHPVFLLDITIHTDFTHQLKSSGPNEVDRRSSVAKALQTAVEKTLLRHGLLIPRRPSSAPDKSSRHSISIEPYIDFSSKVSRRLYDATAPQPRRRSLDVQDVVVNPSDNDSPPSLEWTHEVTGRRYHIDPRTGNSYEISRSNSGRTSTPGDRTSKEVVSQGRRSLAQEASSLVRAACQAGMAPQDEERAAPAWLHKTVTTWTNPVLPLQVEKSIPTLDTSEYGVSASRASLTRREASMALPAVQARSRHFAEHIDKSRTLPMAGNLDEDDMLRVEELEISLDKEALRSAEVIGQADRKFIVVCVDLRAGGRGDAGRDKALVMIDQHAADERIRVERLLNRFLDSCRRGRPEQHTLRTAFQAELSSGEIDALCKRGDALSVLAKVGFDLNIDSKDQAEDTKDIDVRENGSKGQQDAPRARLQVHAVPAIIKDRLLAERSLITALIRTFLALCVDTDGGGGSALLARLSADAPEAPEMGQDGGHLVAWIGLLRTLPRLMLDLIYSRACRGAIMFNDILTREQSERLIAKLAETAFPFQCAHGRPSMLPLLRLPQPALRPMVGAINWTALSKV